MAWIFNGDYKDLSQVAEFYPAYLAIYKEIRAAGDYPYNNSFKGRIPGIAGTREDTAIYLLQNTRDLEEQAARIERYKKAGWRAFDAAEIATSPVRYAGVAEYGFCVGGTGWSEWGSARLQHRYSSSVVVLPGRARVNGHLIHDVGRVLVKDLPVAAGRNPGPDTGKDH